MIDKISPSLQEAVSVIGDGATVMVAGFGDSGLPCALLHALKDAGPRNLTVVSNNAGTGDYGLAALLSAGLVRKVICSYPKSSGSDVFTALYRAGKIELEVVPQGTLLERIRAAGAGLGPFFTPTSYGTPVADGKEQRIYEGVGYVLENPLPADFALLKGDQADRWGNLTYRLAARGFGPVMAMAARHTIAEVNEIVPLGGLAADAVHTPGIFVQSIVRLEARHDR